MMLSLKSIRALLLSCAPIFGATISVQPATTNTSQGKVTTVQIFVSEVFDLYAFQFDIGFDPAILAATSEVEGAFLQTGGPSLFLPGAIDNDAGSISSTADTLIGPVTGVNGSGTLVTLSFLAIAGGSSPISLSNVILLNSLLAPIEASTADGSISVITTPEPASLGMAILGLFACWVVWRLKGRLLIRYSTTHSTGIESGKYL